MKKLDAKEKAAQRRYAVFENRGRGLLRTFDEPEAAALFAQRGAKVAGAYRQIFEVDGAGKSVAELATVTPSGQLDLTVRGSELISADPKRAAARLAEMLA